MKLTVITNDKGQVIATTRGHAADHKASTTLPRAGVLAGPGQKLHEITVPDDLEKIEDAAELHRRVAEHLR